MLPDGISDDEREKFSALLGIYDDVISSDDSDLGCTKHTETQYRDWKCSPHFPAGTLVAITSKGESENYWKKC